MTQEFIDIFNFFVNLNIRNEKSVSLELIKNHFNYWNKIRGYYHSAKYSEVKINQYPKYKNVFKLTYLCKAGTVNTVVIFLSEFHSPVELTYCKNKSYILYSQDGFTREIFEITKENKEQFLEKILEAPHNLLSKIPVPFKYNPENFNLYLQGQFGHYTIAVVLGMVHIFKDGNLTVNFINIYSYSDFLQIFVDMESSDNQMYFDAVDGLMMLQNF